MDQEVLTNITSEKQLSEGHPYENNEPTEYIPLPVKFEGAENHEADKLSTSNVQQDCNSSPSNIPNTIIIHCPNDEVGTPYIRKCESCKHQINPANYLAWEMMDFCNELCLIKFQEQTGQKCVACLRGIVNTWVISKFYIRVKNDFKFFCTKACFQRYKATVKLCTYCEKPILQNAFSRCVRPTGSNFPGGCFCSQACITIFTNISKNLPPEVPQNTKCFVCKAEKPIEIVFKDEEVSTYFCGKRCLIAFSFVKLKVGTGKCIICLTYFSKAVLEVHTAFYDDVLLSFCSSTCRHVYMLLNVKMLNCGWCQVDKENFGIIKKYSQNNVLPPKVEMCSIYCLRLYNNHMTSSLNLQKNGNVGIDVPGGVQGESSSMKRLPLRSLQPTQKLLNQSIDNFAVPALLPLGTNITQINGNANIPFNLPVQNKKQFIIQPAKKIDQRNVATMCIIPKANKASSARPMTVSRMVQTSKTKAKKILVPIPVPIYVPTPMAMFAVPVPFAVPFPIPIPVPVFVPTTRKTLAGVKKEIQKVLNEIPSDPCEAELLKIAGMIAEHENNECKAESSSDSVSDTLDIQSIFNDEEIHEEIDEDLQEYNIGKDWTLNNISEIPTNEIQKVEKGEVKKGRKRSKQSFSDEGAKRVQKEPELQDYILQQDDTVCLNYSLGINAWKQWVTKKNSLLEKSSKHPKLLKTDILQMSPEELNYALCFFIKELKKPNDTEYAPDTIYYLCLGIQYYLNLNRRVDNLFFDQAYDRFNDNLDEVAKKFCALYDDDSQFIITRVEEEHLWETRQLGCHSPQILLNTLIFFNTKYYFCSTIEDHMELSFFHILKHHKRKSKSKCISLRFYPKSKTKKRICEQIENKDNPLRCPVGLYEFYLSRCPESIKTSYDLLYLQPEKYCVSDSPLWYTTTPLPKESLNKMINRVKMVKEINVALLTNTYNSDS